MLRPLGVLWFGTAQTLGDEFVELLAERPETDLLTIDLDGLERID